MDMTVTTIRQHLIDPELCVRCNGCEDTCGQQAITHNHRNYVIDMDRCNACMDCIEQCPTGAADHWRVVPTGQVYSLQEQLTWDALPMQEDLGTGQDGLDTVHSMAPASAPLPVVGRYTRETPLMARVVSNERVTSSAADSDIHHVVLSMGEGACPLVEGQSIGILPPGMDAQGVAHAMRLYSAASPRTGEDGRPGDVALTVKRVLSVDEQGNTVRGVSSNFLCDLAVGDELRIVGPFGNNFLLPDDPSTKLALVATGTGIAPMRAMIERRLATGSATAESLMLIYGGRTPQEMPYLDRLTALHGQAIELHQAVSRVAGQPKRYVQDVVVGEGDKLLRWLREGNGYLFACGLKGMEPGIMSALESACQRAGLDWPQVQQQLKAEHRLHFETY